MRPPSSGRLRGAVLAVVATATAACAPAQPNPTAGIAPTATDALDAGPTPSWATHADAGDASAPAVDGPDAGTSDAAPREAAAVDAGKPRRVTFLSVGDVMYSRGVAAAIRKAGDSKLPYGGFREVFESVDFVFGNLETPIGQGAGLAASGGKIFRAPQDVAAALYQQGFRVLDVANNHALDAGQKGLWHTLATVKAAGIQSVGAGKDSAEAWQPAVLTVRGVRIGFVAACYASVNDSGKTWLPYVARIEDKGRLAKAIASLKGKTDFIVAAMHAGIEYVAEPFGPQRLFAKAAIRAGADVVIGHHPHVVQKVERFAGKVIFHSLGNFIFDKEKPHTDEGAAVRTVLDEGGKLVEHEVIPFVIEGNAVPKPVKGARAEAILKRMALDAALIGTR